MKSGKLLLFIALLILAPVTGQKIEPELRNIIENAPPAQKLEIIVIAEHRLGEAEAQQLTSLGARILINFTLAPWYELEMPAANILRLEELGFIKEVKHVKEYKPLIEEEERIIGERANYNLWLLFLVVVILPLAYYIMKRRFAPLHIMIILFLLLAPAALAGKGASVHPKIEPQILEQPSETVDIILQGDKGYNPKYVQAAQTKKFSNDFYAMKVPKSEISKMEKMGSVKRVWLQKKRGILLDVAVPLVNTSNFWNSGYNGSGVRICVLDTGVNKTHPALAGRVVNESDFTGQGAADGHGHGTHVAGIAASDNSTYRGVAYAASILSAKVCNNSGSCSDPDILSGIDWCIANNAHILTLSLGGGDSTNDGSDSLSAYVDLAADQGKIVTVAAGNSGPVGGNNDCRTSDDGASYSICSPGLAHKVITVGSTGSGKSSTADAISGFSSRGPTKDGRIKPDITAPGSVITSSWYDGGFNSISGTSMSTPMVAGLAALMLQARNMTPAEAKALLMNTAVELGAAGKDSSYGAGRVNGTRLFAEINNTASGSVGSGQVVHNIFVPGGELRTMMYWPENYSVHNDLDFYILSPAGNIFATSSAVNSTDEGGNISLPFSGNWKLAVVPVNVSGVQAYSIAANFKPSAQMQLRTGNASGRAAYHAINVTSAANLTVNLDWNSTDTNMDLYLYNATGDLANYSSGTANYENVSVAAGAGTWLVSILSNDIAAYALTANFPIGSQAADNAAPNVNITEPLNRTYAAQNINVTFSVTDDVNILVNCSLSLDGSLSPLGSFSNSLVTRNVSAADGAHSAYVTCTDSANNTGNSSVINFTLDATPPAIAFAAADANNSFVRRNYTLINLTISDITLDACILEWNSTNYTMSRNGFACYLNRSGAEGTYAYRVYANDSAGNANSTHRTVTFDTTLPSATVAFTGGINSTFSPNGDGAFDEISFNVSASETVNFSTTYLLAANGSRVKTFNKVDNTGSILKEWNGCATVACTGGTLPDGAYKIEITMTDRAGNVNATNLTSIIIDTTPGNVSFTNPTPNNNAIDDNNSIIINVTLSEAGFARLEWNGTSETMNGSATSWFRQKRNLADGNYTFRVYANDSLGNINVSETRWVAINATRNLSSVITNITQALKNVTLAVKASNGSVADSAKLLPFERYTLSFNVSNIFVETADFVISNLNDSAIPNITTNITAALNISSAFNSSGGRLDSYVWIDLNNLLPTGNFTAKIAFPRVYALYFYLNGTKDAPNITRVVNACNENTTNKPCYNISGNLSALYLPSFSGGAGGNDTQGPSVTISSPAATTYSSSSVPLSYTVGDNVAVDRCWYSLSGTNTTLSNCTNTTITAAQGSNTLTLYANDTSGNLNQAPVTFTYTPAATPASSSSSSSSSGGGSGTTSQSTPTTAPTPTPAPVAAKPTATSTPTPATTPTPPLTTNTVAQQIRADPLTGFVTAWSTNFLIGAAILGGLLLLEFRSARRKLKAKKYDYEREAAHRLVPRERAYKLKRKKRR